ncbi:hypothetical protein [Marinomonas shanghaiensis]|uniref:hypothetical protein n=1 Tax=Marinomonas shanghaiensis TaxID=2202418 RepID=UPI003A905F4C
MIEPNIEKQFLQWLYDDYIRRFGYGIRNIDKCNFYTITSIQNLPSEFYKVKGSITTSHVIEYAQELEAKGLLRFSKPGMIFHFTPEGYKAVSASKYQRVLDSLNRNPGAIALVAIIISIASLVTSAITLGT